MLTELFPRSFCLHKTGKKQKILVLYFSSVLLKDKPKIISFLLVSGPTNCPFFGQKLSYFGGFQTDFSFYFPPDMLFFNQL